VVLKYPKNTLEGSVPQTTPSGKKIYPKVNKHMTIFSCNFNVNILAVIVSVIIRGRAFFKDQFRTARVQIPWQARSATRIHGGLGRSPQLGSKGQSTSRGRKLNFKTEIGIVKYSDLV